MKETQITKFEKPDDCSGWVLHPRGTSAKRNCTDFNFAFEQKVGTHPN